MQVNIRLKAALLERGISQREVAFSTGISESQLSTAIRYGKAPAQLRRKVSEFLGVAESQIFAER